MESQFVNFHFHNISDNLGIFNIDIASFMDAKPESLLSIGVHPYNAADANASKQIDLVTVFANNKRVIAIGEIGLDKSIDVDFNTQKEVFISQMIIANRDNKPAIIHCVRCLSDVLQIYKANKFKIPLIFHGFIGKPQAVEQIHSFGGFVSFGAKIIEHRAWDAAIIRAFELDMLFLETDDTVCEIEDVYSIAAKVIGIDVLQLKDKLFLSFVNLFNIDI